MVGIVLVSHSALLAKGIQQLAAEMSQKQVIIVAAGGIDDETMGTNAERIKEAIEKAYTPDGVLILFDLGSALLSTEIAIQMLMPKMRKNIKVSGAPFVEGAIVAAVEASLGYGLDHIHAAAETVKNISKFI
jgi:phosphocarrier protein FPr